jgi:hypothetical protein
MFGLSTGVVFIIPILIVCYFILGTGVISIIPILYLILGTDVVFTIPILIVCYFIPSMVACSRDKRNTRAIFIFNLLLGWSFIGWALALVWANLKD